MTLELKAIEAVTRAGHEVTGIRPGATETKNHTYVVSTTNGEYFAKINTCGLESERDKEAHRFMRANKLLPTIEVVYPLEDVAVMNFIPGLENTPVATLYDRIVDFHQKAARIKYPADITDNPLFVNRELSRFKSRLVRHQDLVSNFWQNTEELLILFDKNSGADASMPRVLVHGDLQQKNLLTGPDRRLYVIDFEYSYFTHASWDLSRALMEMSRDESEKFTLQYIKDMKLSDAVRKIIDRDFVVRTVTEIIGHQQRQEPGEAARRVKIFKTKYTRRLEEILAK